MAEITTDMVKNRLAQFGLTVSEDDESAVQYSINKALELLLNLTNLDELPDGLIYTATERAVGEFLNAKMLFGAGDFFTGFDLDGAVTQLREGDVTVNFDSNASDSAKLEAFIAALTGFGLGLSRYRKLIW